MNRLGFSLFVSAFLAGGAQAQVANYKAVGSVPLGAPDRWDYAVFDQPSGQVYVAHGDRLSVVDGKTAKLLGEVTGIPGGTHGIAISAKTGKGYTDDGEKGEAIVFDPKRLAVTGHIPADQDADGMVLDPITGHVFVVEGDPGAITVIDPAADKAVATIKAGEKMEYAAVDGHGALYVAGEAHRDLLKIDTRTNAIVARWATPDCQSPHGLAIDVASQRLFMGCINSKLVVVDAAKGRIVATLPIGRGSDAIAFDPVRRRVFSSNGLDGTISVFQQRSPDRYEPLTLVKTALSGRTMTLDPKSGRLFVVAADADPSPTPGGKPKPRPGTLRLMMFDPIG